MTATPPWRAAALELALWLAWAAAGGWLTMQGFAAATTWPGLGHPFGFWPSLVLFLLIANLAWSVMDPAPNQTERYICATSAQRSRYSPTSHSSPWPSSTSSRNSPTDDHQ